MYPLHRQRCSCIFTLWSIYIDLWYSAWYGLVTRAFVHQYIPAIFHQSWILPETYCIRVLLLQTTFWGDVVWCQYNSPNCIGCTQRYSKRIGTNMIQNLRRKKHLFLGSCSRVRRVNLKQVVCKYMYVYTFIYIYIYIYTSITIISIHKTCKFTGFFLRFFWTSFCFFMLVSKSSFWKNRSWRLARPMAAKSEAILGGEQSVDL